MSATLESQKFAEYFSETINNTTILPPIIDVEGHAYPVTEFFLDSIQALGQVIVINYFILFYFLIIVRCTII